MANFLDDMVSTTTVSKKSEYIRSKGGKLLIDRIKLDNKTARGESPVIDFTVLSELGAGAKGEANHPGQKVSHIFFVQESNPQKQGAIRRDFMNAMQVIADSMEPGLDVKKDWAKVTKLFVAARGVEIGFRQKAKNPAFYEYYALPNKAAQVKARAALLDKGAPVEELLK